MRPDLNLVKSVTETFKISESAAEAAIGSVILATVLLLFAAGIVLHVCLVSYDRKISVRSAMKYGLSTFWALPVLGVLALFGYRAVEHVYVDEARAEASEKRSRAVLDEQSPRAGLEFVPKTPAEEWTKPRTIGVDEVITVASADTDVIVARGASVAEAERKLAAIARNRLAEKAAQDQPGTQESTMVRQASDDSIIAHAPSKRFVQPGVEKVRVSRPGQSDREISNEVYQVFWKLDLSGDAREKIRRDASVPRLWLLGGLIGLLTLIAASVAAYLRLDARTEGKYRTRLKLATTSFLVAAGLLLTVLLPVG